MLGLRPAGEAAVKLLEAFLDGYRWPEEYNRHMHTLGLHWEAEPSPSFPARVLRGVTWAAYVAREETSDKIHPDGPRP